MSYRYAVAKIVAVLLGWTPEHRKSGCVLIAGLYVVTTMGVLFSLSSIQLIPLGRTGILFVGCVVGLIASYWHMQQLDSLATLQTENLSPSTIDYALISILPFAVAIAIAFIAWLLLT